MEASNSGSRKLEAEIQFGRLQEIAGQMKSIGALQRVIEVMKKVVRESEADATQSAPDGYVYLVAPFELTRSYTFVYPYSHYDSGPNLTEKPGEEYPSYDLTQPFMAHQLIANYNGIFAVNTDTNKCIL